MEENQEQHRTEIEPQYEDNGGGYGKPIND